MKFAFAAAGATAFALTAGVAAAEGHENKEQCFDKGTLTYFDCPVDEPEVVEEEVMEPSQDRFYIGARGGAAWIEADPDSGDEIDFDTGYVVSGMVGYKFADVVPGISFRPELELGYMAADTDVTVLTDSDEFGTVADVDIGVFFGFVNAFADIELIETVDLIVGGGVGFGNVDLDAPGFDDDDTGFGYNVGAGFGVDVADDIVVEAMYRYMSFDVELSGVDTDVDAHTATVGVRFEF